MLRNKTPKFGSEVPKCLSLRQVNICSTLQRRDSQPSYNSAKENPSSARLCHVFLSCINLCTCIYSSEPKDCFPNRSKEYSGLEIVNMFCNHSMQRHRGPKNSSRTRDLDPKIANDLLLWRHNLIREAGVITYPKLDPQS